MVEVLENRETAKGAIGILKAKLCDDLLTAAEDYTLNACRVWRSLYSQGSVMRSLSDFCRSTSPLKVSQCLPNLPNSAPDDLSKCRLPSLAAWLEAYPIGESVLPANWERKEKAVRRHAGWKVWSDLFPKDDRIPSDELPEWPHNALRYTHASAAVAMGVPIERLIFEFGHSGGTATLKSHYVGAMSKAEAFKIMSIGPKGTTISVVREVA